MKKSISSSVKGRAALLTADILVAGLLLCLFCYFHHVRVLWQIGQPTEGEIVTLPEETLPEEEKEADPVLTEEKEPGIFGEKFADQFLKEGEKTVSTGTLYVSRNLRMEYSFHSEKIGKDTVQYHYIEVYLRDLSNLSVAYDANARHPAEEFLTDKAVALISGDYCGNTNAVKETVRNGVEVRATEEITFDVGVLLRDGSFFTLTPSEYDRETLLGMDPWQVWNFGPGIFDENGEIRTDCAKTYGESLAGKKPRQIFCYFEPGHYGFLTIEGRTKKSAGATYETSAEIVASLGCRTAYHLDGGASAYTWFNGRFVRYSDENKKDDPRPIYDVILLTE